jgi:hypothetical protein
LSVSFSDLISVAVKRRKSFFQSAAAAAAYVKEMRICREHFSGKKKFMSIFYEINI